MIPQITKVWQDDIQLVLRFNVHDVPSMYYTNQQLLSRLQHEYDNNIVVMCKELQECGTVDIFFCPDEDGSVDTDMWCALTDILEEYGYTLEMARDIINWMDECVKMDDVDHVYVQILEMAH